MKTKRPSTKTGAPKSKTQVKLRDLKPQKDAKGGAMRSRSADPCEGGE
jgi:hypothetical protein